MVTQMNILHYKDKPLYHLPCLISGTIIKRTVHNNFSGLFFGLAFTKPNPDFVQSVKKQFPEDSKLLVVCQEGLRSAATSYNCWSIPFLEYLNALTSQLLVVSSLSLAQVGRVSFDGFILLLVWFWRSAAAANTLDEQGFENVACLTSGLQSVKPGSILDLLIWFKGVISPLERMWSYTCTGEILSHFSTSGFLPLC